MAVVAVVVAAVHSVAAQRAYAAADDSSGQRVAVEGGGEACTGHSSYRSGGENAMFARAAGGEGKGKDGYGESGKYSVHVFLVVAGSCDAGIAGRAAVFCL